MKKLGIFAAFLGGAALGAAAGILFAPESGKETRRKLAKEGSRLADTLKEKLQEHGLNISNKELESISEELREELL